jgi:hypothetical protein
VEPDSNTKATLKARLKAAREKQKLALKQFQEVLRDIPSGIPQPDSSERIIQASRRVTESHDEVVALLLELNKGSLDGDGKRR